MRDGLASNVTTALEQDPKGFIWIGTLGGIMRYDGIRFVLYRHREGDARTIPNDDVLALRLDRQNRLWVLTRYNNIGYIDLEDLHYHPVRVDMPASTLMRAEGNIHIDFAGHVMLFLGRLGTLAYDPGNGSFSSAALPFQIPKAWSPLSILEDSTARCYYLGCDSGLVRYNIDDHTLSYRGHNVAKDPIIAKYSNLRYAGIYTKDMSGRYWVNSWPPEGAYFMAIYEPRANKETQIIDPLSKALHHQYFEVNFVHQQKNGTIWMSGASVLVTVKKNTLEFDNMKTSVPTEFGIYFDMIHNLLEDRDGNIWLATDKGVYRFNPAATHFHTIANKRPERDSIYTPEVTDIVQLSSGDIIVASWGNGIFAYDSAFRPVDRWYARQSLKLHESGVWCVVQRTNGDIWRGQQAGSIIISHADTKTTEWVTPPILSRSTVRQLAEDKKGDMWLGTQRGKLFRWQAATKAFTVMQDFQSPVQKIYVDLKGDIWVGTAQTGLYHINPSDGSILHHYTSDGPAGHRLAHIGAADIIQYSDSVYAIASNTVCLLNIHTGEIRQAEHADGIPFEGVENIIRDKLGYTWITTRDGLCRLNLRNQIRNVFNEEDGISTNPFNQAAINILNDGRIAIGTAHDVVTFQPREVAEGSRTPPDVEITNIAVMNKWLPMDSVAKLPGLELPYSENALRIAFSTLSYFNSFGIMYKMENLDKNWVNLQSVEAVYNYLPPGHYVFRIYARNGDDAVSPHIRELHINVKNPFWRTWWFFGVLLLLGAAILFWLDRQRMKRKESMEKIRSDISGNLHEEVNKALQNINVLSEIARIKADKAPEQSINFINEIHHQSHNMIIAMDDMLWSIDPVNDTMDRAIDRMKEFAGALSQRHGARVGLEAEDSIRSLRPDMNIRHEFVLIYKLALRLLVEEMKVPGVLVQLDFQRPHLHLTLFAAGARMDDRNSRSIRLLEEMRSRAASVKGTLEMHYDEKGTAILFICPSTF